ncbi:MAG: sortase [Candidatus Dojkabacteria bacterium]
MKKPIKIILTLFLILLVLTPIFFFITYPFYNDIALKLKNLNIYDRTKETFITLLTTISPTPDKFKTEEFSANSIEESIKSTDIILDTKLLEELNTTLSIDNVLIEGRVFQGTSSQTMDLGFWHFPISKYPGQKGNAVIIGHRFLNLPPAKDTFFNLDKVKIGDEIVLKHDEGEWKYIVTETNIVDENDISVVKDTDDYRLTLITCTPLWTSEKRLVVIAKLDKLYQKV